jgi:hypothetical protein
LVYIKLSQIKINDQTGEQITDEKTIAADPEMLQALQNNQHVIIKNAQGQESTGIIQLQTT